MAQIHVAKNSWGCSINWFQSFFDESNFFVTSNFFPKVAQTHVATHRTSVNFNYFPLLKSFFFWFPPPLKVAQIHVAKNSRGCGICRSWAFAHTAYVSLYRSSGLRVHVWHDSCMGVWRDSFMCVWHYSFAHTAYVLLYCSSGLCLHVQHDLFMGVWRDSFICV